MSSPRGELANLRSRDPRLRRKAVRKLFEVGDSTSLAAFAPLLNDEDIWFRERARRAFELWCAVEHGDLVSDNLAGAESETLILFARLLGRLGSAGDTIAAALIESEHVAVRCEAWAYLLDSATVTTLPALSDSILEDSDHMVRIVLASRITAVEKGRGALINRLLADSHPKVVARTLASLAIRDDEFLQVSALENLCHSNSVDIRLQARLIAIRRAISAADHVSIASLLAEEDLSVQRRLIACVSSEDWTVWPEFIATLESYDSWRAISLLAITNSTKSARDLQLSLAGDRRVAIGDRLRIIDRLMGRASSIDLSELVGQLLDEEDPRLIQAGEQLQRLAES